MATPSFARHVAIIAHRGSSAAAPENTLAAFNLGFSEGADAIECDLRTSAGGEIVMMHDRRLARTTHTAGLVGDFTLAELKRLDAGSWHSTEYAGERIPTLAETLAAAEGKGKVFLDIKSASPATVAAAVAASKLSQSEVLVLTWNHAQESQFVAALPGSVVLRTPWKQPSRWTDRYIVGDRNRGGGGYGFWHSSITKPFVDDAHRFGMFVYAFTVNTTADAQRLVDIGVDGIITDSPAAIRAGVDFDPTPR
jgi:glycerophosphoryl diester phosphodiesterase